MHRIDTPTAQKDKFGAGKNGFTRGNPQTGTPATALDDDYWDSLQEELCGVIEASGEVLEKAKRDQLLTALRILFLSRLNPFAEIASDGPAAISAALNNLGIRRKIIGAKTFVLEIAGLTIQMGTWSIAAPTGSTTVVTYPQAFPSSTLGILVGVDGAASQMAGSISRSNSTAEIAKGGQDASARTGSYFVVGY